MPARPQCVVVIPTYNGAHLLRPCLKALLAHPPRRCMQRIIVVDDASTDETTAVVGAFGDVVQLLRQPVNGGFAKACNAGAELAAGADYVVFLNNDTVPVAGWIDELVRTAEAHPEAGAVGAKLLFPNGTVQHAGVAISQDRWPRHLYVGFPSDHSAVNRPKEVAVATAACLLVRRDVFERLGGFDEAFHNGFEDVDLCLRIRELGRTIRYCPTSVVYHLESVTRWPDADRPSTAHNDRLYRERWRDRVVPDDLAHYVADGLISVTYGSGYPQRFEIAPELGAVDRGSDGAALARMLTTRSEQVMELQAEQIRADLAARRARAHTAVARPRSGGEPRVLHRGTLHQLGDGPPRHRVSVLMPLLNAGDDLREIVPRLLSQRASALLEIIGVDSASEDDTVEVLAGFGGTVIGIDPADFDHGLTRNLAAAHASGDVLVFLNGRTRPVDDEWLAPLLSALEDPAVAGACSRVLPRPDADPLTMRDGRLELSGSAERAVKRIDDWRAYRAMSEHERRVLLNFHTVSAAIRADAFARIPFRSVRAIGEDLLWAREILEAGYALVHEPASRAYHSHNYSLREWFERNVDDGIANRDINDRRLDEQEALALAQGMIASDWRYLRDELGIVGDELERWQIHAAMRRIAQVAGQWLGVNHPDLPPEASLAFSRVANARRARSS